MLIGTILFCLAVYLIDKHNAWRPVWRIAKQLAGIVFALCITYFVSTEELHLSWKTALVPALETLCFFGGILVVCLLGNYISNSHKEIEWFNKEFAWTMRRIGRFIGSIRARSPG